MEVFGVGVVGAGGRTGPDGDLFSNVLSAVGVGNDCFQSNRHGSDDRTWAGIGGVSQAVSDRSYACKVGGGSIVNREGFFVTRDGGDSVDLA